MALSFLREFLKSPDWQQMQDLLEKAVETSILWVAESSGRSVQKMDDRYPELCQLVRASSEGLKRCRNSSNARFQAAKRARQPVVSACYCGLVGFAIPLILNEEIIGVAGGCHHRAESPITMEKCAEISNACNIDLKEVMTYAKKVKHMPRIEQKRLLSTLSMFAGMVSLLMNRISESFVQGDQQHLYAAKLSALSEISSLAVSDLDWGEMVKVMAGRTKAAMDADACSVYQLDQDKQELVLSITDGLPAAVVGQRIKIGEGITGHVAQDLTSIAVEDATSDPRAISFPIRVAAKSGEKQRSYRSILSVPLIVGDRLIGVMDVRTFQTKQWSQADVHVLSIIAAQVAGIIDRNAEEY